MYIFNLQVPPGPLHNVLFTEFSSMVTRLHATEQLTCRFPNHTIKHAIVGDSLVQHVDGHFHPSEPNAPGFISYSGLKFEDVPATFEYLPPTVEAPILHVGSADIAASGSSRSLQKLKDLLTKVRHHRPALRRILLSLPLPRALNWRQRRRDRRFVALFNRKASNFVREVRRPYHCKDLGRRSAVYQPRIP